MPVTTVKDRVTELARDVLGPPLSSRGFRRKGRVFWRDGPKACQVITLAVSRWGTRSASDFDVFLGVFWHDVEKLLGTPSSGIMPPPCQRCTFRIDLGWTTPKRSQKSWAVDLTTDLPRLGGEVLSDLTGHGLPWLDYRSQLKRALVLTKFLEPDGFGAYTSHESVSARARVVFMVKLGKSAQARKELERSVAVGTPAADVRRFARRLGLEWK